MSIIDWTLLENIKNFPQIIRVTFRLVYLEIHSFCLPHTPALSIGSTKRGNAVQYLKKSVFFTPGDSFQNHSRVNLVEYL